MIQKCAITSLSIATLACTAWASNAQAQMVASDVSDVVNVTLLPGWREADGTHIAGVKISLAPGWKTYWRTPGDGGVPTRVDLEASGNLDHARVLWPTPEVFRQNGMRSIGYRDEVIVPIALQAASDGTISLRGTIDFGVCEEICLPVQINLEHLLPPDHSANVETLTAALQNRPITSQQAELRSIDCAISYTEGQANINVTVDMKAPSGLGEALVIEAGNPAVWVSEPTTQRNGDVLTASAQIMSPTGDAFRLDPSQIRFTVLTTTDAIDIQGCD